MRDFPVKNLYYILGSIFLLVYTLLIEGIVSGENDLIHAVNISMLIVILPAYLWLLTTTYNVKKKVGFFFIFLILSIIFYYGQYLLICFGQSEKLRDEYVSLLCGRLTDSVVIRTLFAQIKCLLIVHIGSLFTIREDSYNTEIVEDEEIDSRDINIPYGYHIVALCLFLVSSVMVFIMLFYNMTLGAYMTVRGEESSIYTFSSGNPMFYVSYISQWFLPSYYMLLLYNAITKRRNEYNLLLIFICIYSVVYLLTGARFQLLKIALAVFLIHYYFVERITWKQLKWIIPIAIIGMLLLSSMSQARQEQLSIKSLFSGVNLNSIGDLVYNIFLEPANASVSLASTMQYCPSQVPHLYFESFLKVIGNILPSFINPFYKLGTTTTSSIFSPLFYRFSGTGYGSSFITEAYYYWGSFMYIIMFIYGLTIGNIEKSFSNLISNKNIFVIFMSIYMLSEMIYCVRNDVFSLGRYFTYYVFLPWLLVSIVNSLVSRRLYSNYKVKGLE